MIFLFCWILFRNTPKQDGDAGILKGLLKSIILHQLRNNKTLKNKRLILDNNKILAWLHFKSFKK